MTYLNYKDGRKVIEEHKEQGVMFLSFPALDQTGIVRHGFSTRLGGVSEGIFSSMNLSFGRGDEPERVRENYRRMGNAMGTDCRNMVLGALTHSTNVRRVTEKDRGNGIVEPQQFQDVDGLITNVPDVCLVTTYADCVPLYFVDPVRRAVGLSHSGWRGTVKKIGQVTLERMREEFGTDPKDVIAVVGPSICQDCYEVSEDVIEEFQNSFDEERWQDIFAVSEVHEGKYQLNLWKANEYILLDSGILPEHLSVTNLCTCCNSEVLFSHRASHGQRGGMAAFLELK